MERFENCRERSKHYFGDILDAEVFERDRSPVAEAEGTESKAKFDAILEEVMAHCQEVSLTE